MAVGVKPSLATFQSLMKMYQREANAAAITKVIERIRQSGLAPDIATFHLLLESLGRQRLLKHMKYWFTKMERDFQVHPEQSTFEIIFLALKNHGQIDEMLGCVEELKKRNLKMTSSMYDSIISAYRSRLNMGEMSNWFHLKRQSKVTPSQVSVRQLNSLN